MKYIELVENPGTSGCKWVWREWDDWVMRKEWCWTYSDNNTDDILKKIILGVGVLK